MFLSNTVTAVDADDGGLQETEWLLQQEIFIQYNTSVITL